MDVKLGVGVKLGVKVGLGVMVKLGVKVGLGVKVELGVSVGVGVRGGPMIGLLKTMQAIRMNESAQKIKYLAFIDLTYQGNITTSRFEKVAEDSCVPLQVQETNPSLPARKVSSLRVLTL